MIRLFSILALCITLSACGAGQAIAEPTPGDSSAFVSIINGAYGTVEGQGVSLLDRQYDAMSYIATYYTDRPSSTQYRLMMSDSGLSITLVDRATGKGVTGTVWIRKDGMHIII